MALANRSREFLTAAFLVCLTSAAMAQASDALMKKTVNGTGANALVSKAQTEGHVRVIVLFESPVSPDAVRPDAVASVASKVAAARDPIVASHFGDAKNPTQGQGFARGLTTFPITPGFAVNVSAQELEALAADPRILTIQRDDLARPHLNESLPLIGAPAAFASGATGNGQTVAVLDTGVKATHEFLNGKVIAEACFSNAGNGGTGLSLCPNGAGSQTGSGAADPNSTNCNNGTGTTFNLCYHGTHVAGTAAGFNTGLSGSEPPNGVAKGAKILAIQVFTRFNDTTSCNGSAPCVLAYTSDILSALNYVYANPAPGGFPVASVNMSLGGGAYSGACDGDSRKPIIDSLLSAGIMTVISAGNNGFTSQVGAPGCISTAVTVGSSSKTDVISSFTNMSSVVDVMAPGGESGGSCVFNGSPAIVAPVVQNDGSTTGYGCLIGTSMAAPHVAGAIADIKSKFPGATPSQIQTALVSTGIPIVDNRSGGTLTKPRIRVREEALQGWWTWSVAGVGDFNGNGHSDILWRNVDGTVGIWLLNNGAFQSWVGLGSLSSSWSVAGVADFNGNGQADILWRNVDGSVWIWLMSGGAVQSAINLGSVPTGWTVAGLGDFNGDGQNDILWRQAGGAAGIWLLNGGAFQSWVGLGVIGTDWDVAGVGDISGDGKADIIWRNVNGFVGAWLLNNGVFQSWVNFGAVSPTWRVVDLRDFNGDAKADILWRNAAGSTGLWLLNGGAAPTWVDFGAPPATWSIVGARDFTGDNQTDILWRSGDGATGIWRMNGGAFQSWINLGAVP